jgi:MFS family permease
LSQTLIIPIQSELPRLLGTSAANAAWVVTITLLSAAVAMPITGRLADIFGKQRMLVVTSGFLAAGSLVCALSSALGPVLIGRALQGIAMGYIPVGVSLIRELLPPDKATSAMATMSATLGVGGATGLPLSAWIVETANWHFVFWFAFVAAAAIGLLSWFVVPHIRDAAPSRVDFVGGVGLALGLATFLVGITKAPTWGWTDLRSLVCIVTGIVVLLAWGAFESRISDPLVDLPTTMRLPVLMTNVAAVAIGFGMMAQSIVVPQLRQLPSLTGYGLGQSVLEAGLWMAPGGLVMMCFAPVSGRLIRSQGPKSTLIVGASVLGGGYFVALFLMGASWQLLVGSCVVSAGVGIGYAAMPTLILDAVPPAEAASAVGVNALARSIGTTMAAAVMGTVLSASSEPYGGILLPSKEAFQLCFVIGGASAILGASLAASIPRAGRRPSNTAGSAGLTHRRSRAARPGVVVSRTRDSVN